MRVQAGLNMEGFRNIAGLGSMVIMRRPVCMMFMIMSIDRDNVNGLKIVSLVGMRRRGRGHAVLRKRNHEDRRQDRSQEPHGPSLYWIC